MAFSCKDAKSEHTKIVLILIKPFNKRYNSLTYICNTGNLLTLMSVSQ